MTHALPALDRPLGSLDFRVRRTGTADGTPFAAVGRRARAAGTGSGGIDGLWAGDARVARSLHVEDAPAREVMETPLGVERRLERDGVGIVERVVVHPDAPVAWIEWVREPTEVGDDGTGLVLELSWRTGLDGPRPPGSGAESRSGPDTERTGAPDAAPAWERLDRGIVIGRDAPGVRVFFVLSESPLELTVDPADGDREAFAVRARVPVPGSGLRLAVVGVEPGDDADRLLRIAGRTRVAVRGREGRANRLLESGIGAATPDPVLDRSLQTARLRLDAAGLPPVPGVWRMEDAARAALAHMVTGDFGAVLAFLQRLVRIADGGRVPDRVLAGAAVSHDSGRAGLLFLLLVARYLAWSGDLRGVRGLWPGVEAVIGALAAAGWPDAAHAGLAGVLGGPDAADAGLRTTALTALAAGAEEVGEREMATRLRGVAGGGDGGAPDPGVGASGELRPRAPAEAGGGSPSGAPVVAADDPAGVLLERIGGLLGPFPDASRGRLELRPRPPEGWDWFEVRGLPVGTAAVDVAYRRDGDVQRFEVEQTRGAAPLQVALTPELAGGAVTAVRVDGKPAELDVERVGDRVRVPVQLVLDHVRTLEVECADDTG